MNDCHERKSIITYRESWRGRKWRWCTETRKHRSNACQLQQWYLQRYRQETFRCRWWWAASRPSSENGREGRESHRSTHPTIMRMAHLLWTRKFSRIIYTILTLFMNMIKKRYWFTNTASIHSDTYILLLLSHSRGSVSLDVGEEDENKDENRTDNGHHSEEKLNISKGRVWTNTYVGLITEELTNESSNESTSTTGELEDGEKDTVESRSSFSETLLTRAGVPKSASSEIYTLSIPQHSSTHANEKIGADLDNTITAEVGCNDKSISSTSNNHRPPILKEPLISHT